jgi:hypothetical protein
LLVLLLFFDCFGCFDCFVVDCCFFAWSLSLLSRAAAEAAVVSAVIVASIGGRAGGNDVVVTMVVLFEVRRSSLGFFCSDWVDSTRNSLHSTTYFRRQNSLLSKSIARARESLLVVSYF